MDISAGHDQEKIEPLSWNFVGPKLHQIDLLEAENKSLRTQIEILTKKQQYDQEYISGKHSSTADRAHGQHTVSSSATVQADDSQSTEYWKQRFDALKKEHTSLQDRHAGCEQEIRLKNEKLREARESVRAWKAYADKRAKERDAKNARGSRPPSHAGLEGSDDMVTTSRALPVAQNNTEAGHTEHEPTTNSDSNEIPSSPPKPKAGPMASLLPVHSPTRSVASRVTSSQTTVDEPQQRSASAVVEKLTSSDSEPVLVSTRSLKRKAKTSAPAEPLPRRIKQEPNSPDAPMHIKSEDFSSPHTTPTRAVRAEMSDLDNVGPLMITPRRPHRNKDLRSRATSEEAARLPPTLTRTASSLSEGNTGAQEVLSAANTAGRKVAAEQIGAQPLRTTPVQGDSRSSGNVLRPISNNISAAAGSRTDRTKSKAKIRRTGAKDNVNLLSEAGDSSPAKAKHVTNLIGQPVRETDADHRLEDMLATQDPSRGQTPDLSRGPSVEKRSGQKARASPHLPTPVSLVKRASPAKRRSPVKVPRGLEKPPPDVKPEDEHLRLKNVRALKLADFKINPKYLGTEFAWADTLRGRDQRRGLHTCTDPACCGGAMQKAIEMAGTELSGKTDRQVLEAFLGPNWESEISAYNIEKRKEVVKQAHIFCFSNQHGKHKTAFQRRSTPPGFWDTDFPTTQEDAENRVQAKEAERREIEQRYREAMRDGGRWKFRDE